MAMQVVQGVGTSIARVLYNVVSKCLQFGAARIISVNQAWTSSL